MSAHFPFILLTKIFLKFSISLKSIIKMMHFCNLNDTIKFRKEKIILKNSKNKNDNIFGNRLKILREKNHESQEELAKALNTNRTTIFRYENGNTPQVPMLKEIALYYNVSLDYLCGLIDSPVILDKITNYNSIPKCIERAKSLLDQIEIQYQSEINKKNK